MKGQTQFYLLALGVILVGGVIFWAVNGELPTSPGGTLRNRSNPVSWFKANESPAKKP